MHQTDLTMRPITGPEELGLFSRLPYLLNDELADDLAVGRRRPEWMWVALRGDPTIAYLAVLPAHRGKGYVDDLLAEGTRVLAEQGVPRVRAATDLGNTPMAAAFRRAGYVNFQREITMTWG